VLLGGDLDAVPHSDTILALTEAGLIDVCAAAGQPPGYTNDEHDLDLFAGCACYWNMLCTAPRRGLIRSNLPPEVHHGCGQTG